MYETQPVETIPTGLPQLNEVLGLDGLPRGHMVELLGPPQSGKTTFILPLIAAAQAAGASVAFIDSGQQLDAFTSCRYLSAMQQMLISQCSELEQSLEIARILVSHNAVDLVVIDGVSSLVPRCEMDAPITASGLGAPPSSLLDGLHRLSLLLKKSRCCVLVIDLVRDCDDYPFGTLETTAVVRTITPFSSIRLQLRVERPVTRGSGRLLRVVKNRLGLVGETIRVPAIAS